MGLNVPECVAANPTAPKKCAVLKSKAIAAGPAHRVRHEGGCEARFR